MANIFNTEIFESHLKNVLQCPTTMGRLNAIIKNEDKVKVMVQMMRDGLHIPNVPLRNPKSNVISARIRQNGNTQYGLKKPANLYLALELYNESLCHAELNSEDLSLAYANRSAIFQKWHLFSLCIENIDHAKATKSYPERFIPKIDRRAEECWTSLTDGAPPSVVVTNDKLQLYAYEPTLTSSPNPIAPHISGSIELAQSLQYGRHIKSNCELRPGHVLSIEDCCAHVLDTAYVYRRCSYCLGENFLNLIPCPQCTRAMFCNNRCLSAARNSFHQFECPIIDYLQVVFNDVQLMGIRVLLKSFVCFESTNDLMDFFKLLKHTASNTFSPLNVMGLTDDQKILHQICSLETNETKRNIPDIMYWVYFAALVYLKFTEYTPLARLCSSEMCHTTLMNQIFQLGQIAVVNCHGLFTIDQRQDTYATALYPFASLFNHSCTANVTRFAYGSKLVILVLRPIRPGEQLFDNYGFNHYFHSRTERLRHLIGQHFFFCKCLACKHNYPMCDDLPTVNLHDISAFEDLHEINYHHHTEKFVMDVFSATCRYLRAYDKHYPCCELAMAQIQFKRFYNMLLKNVPLKLKKYVEN